MVTLVGHTNCPGRLITQSKLSQLEAWCIKKAPHAVGEKIESQTNIQRFQFHSYFYFVQKRRKIWLWSAPASFASDLLINSAGYNQCWALSKSDIAALPPVPHHTSFHISSVLTPRLSQRSSPTPPVFICRISQKAHGPPPGRGWSDTDEYNQKIFKKTMCNKHKSRI